MQPAPQSQSQPQHRGEMHSGFNRMQSLLKHWRTRQHNHAEALETQAATQFHKEKTRKESQSPNRRLRVTNHAPSLKQDASVVQQAKVNHSRFYQGRQTRLHTHQQQQQAALKSLAAHETAQHAAIPSDIMVTSSYHHSNPPRQQHTHAGRKPHDTQWGDTEATGRLQKAQGMGTRSTMNPALVIAGAEKQQHAGHHAVLTQQKVFQRHVDMQDPHGTNAEVSERPATHDKHTHAFAVELANSAQVCDGIGGIENDVPDVQKQANADDISCSLQSTHLPKARHTAGRHQGVYSSTHDITNQYKDEHHTTPVSAVLNAKHVEAQQVWSQPIERAPGTVDPSFQNTLPTRIHQSRVQQSQPPCIRRKLPKASHVSSNVHNAAQQTSHVAVAIPGPTLSKAQHVAPRVQVRTTDSTPPITVSNTTNMVLPKAKTNLQQYRAAPPKTGTAKNAQSLDIQTPLTLPKAQTKLRHREIAPPTTAMPRSVQSLDTQPPVALPKAKMKLRQYGFAPPNTEKPQDAQSLDTQTPAAINPKRPVTLPKAPHTFNASRTHDRQTIREQLSDTAACLNLPKSSHASRPAMQMQPQQSRSQLHTPSDTPAAVKIHPTSAADIAASGPNLVDKTQPDAAEQSTAPMNVILPKTTRNTQQQEAPNLARMKNSSGMTPVKVDSQANVIVSRKPQLSVKSTAQVLPQAQSVMADPTLLAHQQTTTTNIGKAKPERTPHTKSLKLSLAQPMQSQVESNTGEHVVSVASDTNTQRNTQRVVPVHSSPATESKETVLREDVITKALVDPRAHTAHRTTQHTFRGSGTDGPHAPVTQNSSVVLSLPKTTHHRMRNESHTPRGAVHEDPLQSNTAALPKPNTQPTCKKFTLAERQHHSMDSMDSMDSTTNTSNVHTTITTSSAVPKSKANISTLGKPHERHRVVSQPSANVAAKPCRKAQPDRIDAKPVVARENAQMEVATPNVVMKHTGEPPRQHPVIQATTPANMACVSQSSSSEGITTTIRKQGLGVTSNHHQLLMSARHSHERQESQQTRKAFHREAEKTPAIDPRQTSTARHKQTIHSHAAQGQHTRVRDAEEDALHVTGTGHMDQLQCTREEVVSRKQLSRAMQQGARSVVSAGAQSQSTVHLMRASSRRDF